MTNNEMMRADMLDILFQNRNKQYGAYTLRRGYDKRLSIALLTGVALITGFIILARFTSKNESVVSTYAKETILLKEVKMPKEKIKQPEKQKEITKPKEPAIKKTAVATIKVTPPVITPDDKVKEPAKANEAVIGKQISTTNTIGKPDDGIVKQPLTIPTDGKGDGIVQAGPAPAAQPDFIVQEKDPEFPGGQEAFKKFMARYLVTPESLEAGEMKTVRIKFKVDKDGSVNSFEIVNSGGTEFDKEVVRVCKKMPKWVPAIQNGVNVPVHYVIPVIFMGIGE
ncbi:MAG: hypothetical protein RIR12_1501 [Bacteroidota bacterium]|jgi:protein TonB